jgi:CheY-like chemotaxis protein
MRIGIVDDDQTFLDLASWLIRDRGWEAVLLAGETGAFEALVHANLDLIMLDVRMESSNSGWSLLSQLERDPRTRDVPIIICSAALDDIRSHEEWLQARGIFVLNKPFEIDVLYHLMDTVHQSAGTSRQRLAGA